jgi:GNAT superfamily N-acetyltransferase
MNLEFTFTDLNKNNIEYFNEFYEIYSNSIEVSEQKSEKTIKELINHPDYFIRLALIENTVAGFSITYTDKQNQFSLLEYMAVNANLRSQGLGKAIFNDIIQVLQKNSECKNLLIEVDSPYQKAIDIVNRKRRVQFYERQGCLEIEGLDYILPLPSTKPLPEMKLLVYQLLKSHPFLAIEKKNLLNMVTGIYTHVYKCQSTDSRLNSMFTNLPETIKLINTTEVNSQKGGAHVRNFK